MQQRVTELPYDKSYSFTELAIDLHAMSPSLQPFVNRFFRLPEIPEQIREKSEHPVDRQLLVSVLKEQYGGLAPAAVSQNIDRLAGSDCYTITTGHQLCLFGGPLYFIYKISHAISLAARLSADFPRYSFVPLFWMAGEDHDFEEVNHAVVNGHKISWDRDSGARPVGRLDTAGIGDCIQEVLRVLGGGPHTNRIIELLEKCYLDAGNLAEATRRFVNTLFGSYGLVVLDADDSRLKQRFSPLMEKELVSQFSFHAVSSTTEKLREIYKAQVHPRELNLFLFEDGQRQRLRTDGSGYRTEKGVYSRQELLDRLSSSPQDFSPNVVLRPLYQEHILPNLAYIGGGGELAYWVQLKQLFAEAHVPFPMLLLRKSFLLLEEDISRKINELGLDIDDIFLPDPVFERRLMRDIQPVENEILSDFSQSVTLSFGRLKEAVSSVDGSLAAHVAAREAAVRKFVTGLEKKLYRELRKKHHVRLTAGRKVKQAAFPGGVLQERKENVLTYLFRHGDEFIRGIVESTDAENRKFTVLEL